MPIKDPPKKGERRGGRKPGVPNKASAAREQNVAITGDVPLDVLIWGYRRFKRQADLLDARAVRLGNKASRETDPVKKLDLLDMRNATLSDADRQAAAAVGAAEKAAPYIHPRLATLQSNVNLTGRLTLGELVRMSLPSPAANDEVGQLLDITPERVDEK